MKLQTLLPPRLQRQTDHRNKSNQNERAGRIDRRLGVRGAGVDGDERGAEAADPVEGRGDACPCAALGRWEDFGCTVEVTLSALPLSEVRLDYLDEE